MSSIDTEFRRLWKKAEKIYSEVNNFQQSQELKRYLTEGFDSYCYNWLKAHPTSDQLKIAELAEQPPYRVLIPSANNQGKTWLMAAYARYFYEKYNPSITLITATTAGQVRDAVFRELRTSSPSLQGFKPKATRVESSPDHYIHGFTTSNPDAFQGRHELNLALLFDEATGIDSHFWERAGTMFGGHTGHVWLASYNPNDSSTQPYLEEESGNWHIHRLSALNHPNIVAELQGLPPPIPSAVRLVRVLDRLQNECELVTEPLSEQETQLCFEFPTGTGYWWKPRSQGFEAQVLGRWPLLPTESILSPNQVDKCFGHMFHLSEDWQLVISCDIARFGSDRTCIVVRRGPCVLHVETFQKRDSLFVIERLKWVLWKFATEQEARNVPIYIDDTGGYGGGVVDHMQGFNIVPLHMASKSPFPLRTVNMRSYLWFSMAEAVISNVVDFSRLPQDTLMQLRRELTTPRYRIDEMGRKKLEPKVHIKERLSMSPDIGDALAMSFYLAG